MKKEPKIHIVSGEGVLCRCAPDFKALIGYKAYTVIRYYGGFAHPAPYFCKNCVKAFNAGEKKHEI